MQGPRFLLHTNSDGMIDLNSLIDPLSGWEPDYATGINAARQIGSGCGTIDGESHASFPHVSS